MSEKMNEDGLIPGEQASFAEIMAQRKNQAVKAPTETNSQSAKRTARKQSNQRVSESMKGD